MKALLKRCTVVAAVLAGFAHRVAADELVMPYDCRVAAGTITLSPSRPVAYRIEGARAEVPFSDCSGAALEGPSACQATTAHKFQLACRGGTAAWADIADAARRSGAVLPQGSPPGYAPIGALRARIMLPALARFSAHSDAVASEALTNPPVAEADPGDAPAGAWTTVIEAGLRPEVPGAALRVAGIIGTLLAAFLLAGFIAARQGPTALLQTPPRLRAAADHLLGLLARLYAAAALALFWPNRDHGDAHDLNLVNALSIATARMAETDLLLATLPPALALRGVLQVELDQVRGRLGDIQRTSRRRPLAKSAAAVRSVLRDLERIARIAHGAARDTGGTRATAAANGALEMPGCVQDAYRVLGINGDAAPAVAKKLVDALRMSWHPDFARDDDDRRLREARMKQINAAWDLIKNRPPQAA